MRGKARTDRVSRIRYSEEYIERQGLSSIRSSKVIEIKVLEEALRIERVKAYNKCRLRGYCIYTGRSRGIVEGTSRQLWKKHAENGILSGVRRASW